MLLPNIVSLDLRYVDEAVYPSSLGVALAAGQQRHALETTQSCFHWKPCATSLVRTPCDVAKCAGSTSTTVKQDFRRSTNVTSLLWGSGGVAEKARPSGARRCITSPQRNGVNSQPMGLTPTLQPNTLREIVGDVYLAFPFRIHR